MSDRILHRQKTLLFSIKNSQKETAMADDVIAYCVKCKAKQTMLNPQTVTMKNGREAAQGKCPVCGTGMYKILPKK